jgi:transcriptional regulator with GAF, ATPase, and Fis domain
MASNLFGYNLTRRIVDEIKETSRHLVCKLPMTFNGTGDPPAENNELYHIVQSFRTLEDELRNSIDHIKKRVSQIMTLKELSDLCYVTFDKDDLFHITLERALRLVSADVGSVLLLESAQRKAFVVQANIGLSDVLQLGDRIDFKDSIAKFAVINNSPILVDDIENDSRFGRERRSRYATKSFLCMPIKGSSEVFGVLTLSRRNEDTPFSQDDVTVLAPLLSNAAFTYENQLLSIHDKEKTLYLDVMEKSSGSSIPVCRAGILQGHPNGDSRGHPLRHGPDPRAG